MKKLIIPIIIALFLAPFALAEEIFNGEVKDNVPFFVDGVKHIVKYYPSAKKLSVGAGESRILVALGECADIDAWKYCFDSASEGYDDETGDPVSTSTIRILVSGPEISIERDIAKTDPLLNEEVEIITVITNVGNERGSGITFTDYFPSQAKVSGSAYDAGNNGMTWSGGLNPDESYTMHYRVRFTDFTTFDSTAKAVYYYKDKSYTKTSDTETFTVQKPFEVIHSLSSESPAEGEEVTYTLNISNDDPAETLDVDAAFNLPSGFTVTSRDLKIKESAGKYTYTSTIEVNGNEAVSLKFKPMKKGEQVFSVDLNMKSGTLSFDEGFSQDMRVGISNIVPYINITPDPVKSGREMMIEARISNTDKSKISAITLEVDSDFLEKSLWKTIELEPGKKYYAYNKLMSAPFIEEEKEYYITLKGSYNNAAGKTLFYSETKTFTVLPAEKLVELTPDIIIDGRNVNVTLRVKSLAAYKINGVSLIDTLPKGFGMVGGERFVDLDSLAVGEEIVAYSYVFKIPDTFSGKSLTVSHMFSGKDQKGEIVSFEKSSIVNLSSVPAQAETPAEEAAAEETNASETADGAETAQEDAPKEGIFGKIGGFFSGIWDWLLGKDKKTEDSGVLASG